MDPNTPVHMRQRRITQKGSRLQHIDYPAREEIALRTVQRRLDVDEQALFEQRGNYRHVAGSLSGRAGMLISEYSLGRLGEQASIEWDASHKVSDFHVTSPELDAPDVGGNDEQDPPRDNDDFSDPPLSGD